MRTLFTQPMQDPKHDVVTFVGVIDGINRNERDTRLSLSFAAHPSAPGAVSWDYYTIVIPQLLDGLYVEQELRIEAECVPIGKTTGYRTLRVLAREHAKPVTRYLVVSSEWGVYLGSCLGMLWWSALDPVGQDSAFTFATQEAAGAFIADVRANDTTGDADLLMAIPVAVTGDFASIAECVSAGAPAWSVESEA